MRWPAGSPRALRSTASGYGRSRFRVSRRLPDSLACPYRALQHLTPCVEIGWRLAVAHWGQGYATEGAAAVLKFGIETLGLPEIVSFTSASNHRSRAVMERLGMRRDSADDFEHPGLPEGHPLRSHVLYRYPAALHSIASPATRCGSTLIAKGKDDRWADHPHAASSAVR